MNRIIKPVLFIAIIVFCQNSQSQLTAKENSRPKQAQITSTVQATPKKVKALTIGDRVPDFAFNFLNYSGPGANLSSFKGKLIILDFWASWCYSCLHAVPKLNKLQNKFSDKLQLIFVNSAETSGDNREKVVQAVKKFSPDGPWSFLVSYDDSIALKFFPHVYLPHYVWITPNGIVKAITEPDALTEENIKAILQNENVELSLPIKMDYFPNKLMDLGLEGQAEIDENLGYYSVFKRGRIEGLSKVNTRRDVPNKERTGVDFRGISFRNVTPLDLFETATKYSKNQLNGDFKKRLILEIKDTSNFIFDPSKMTIDAWEKNNLYTYDLVLPDDEIKNIDEYIWRDLNKYSGYTVHIESRNLNCLVLTETAKAKLDHSKETLGPSITIQDGTCSITNSSAGTLSDVLDRNPHIKIPVVNKVKKDIRFDISFDYDHLDLKKLRQQIAPLGLELTELKQHINVLVISDKNSKK
jgi:thiol-disulfide isomerase/thioredoxin